MKFDVCIIGSGAGGAAVAWGLKDSGLKIAVIEKGDWIKRDQTESWVLQHIYRDQGFVGAVGNAFIGVPTGEAVGGTTTINSGTCFDTPKTIVEEWNQKLNIPLDYEELTPHFKTLTHLLSIKEVPEERISIGNKLFRDGLKSLGFTQYFPLKRAEHNCQGAGRCPFVCPNSAKQSVDLSLLPDFLKSGGTLLYKTTVVGIEETRQNIRLACVSNNNSFTIQCKQLILSAGSLSTPLLIRRHRLGHSWKQAGNGLTIHPATKVFAQFPKPIHSWKGVPQALGFKHPHFPMLSFEGVFTPMEISGLVLPVIGHTLQDWFTHYNQVASFGVLLKDSSSGTIRSYPIYGPWLHYHLPSKDFYNLVEAARFLGLTYLAAGAKKVLLPFTTEDNEFTDFDYLKTFDFSTVKPSQLNTMGFHPLGTCGIHRVVDSNLRLYGSERIFVADGSVVPTSLGVNPQITIMSLAMRLSEYFNKTTF